LLLVRSLPQSGRAILFALNQFIVAVKLTYPNNQYMNQPSPVENHPSNANTIAGVTKAEIENHVNDFQRIVRASACASRLVSCLKRR